MLTALKNYKRLIALVTIIVTLFGIALNSLIYYNKQSMRLSLDYIGIEKGLNPDGSKFNIFEIVSDDVINMTLNKLNITDMSIEDAKDRVTITALQRTNSVETVKRAITSGSNYVYVPNEFTISYSQKNKLKTSRSIEFLDALASSYKEYFIEHHTEKNNILKMDDIDLNGCEYIEIADIYKNKINSMISYLRKHDNENGTFRSTITNETYVDLISRLTNLRDIELEKLRSYIITNSITKDRGRYLSRLQYTYDSKNDNKIKAEQSRDFTKGALEKYDPRITSTIFIPSMDKENKFYMNKTQTGLDYLANDAYSKGMEAEAIQGELDYCNYLIKAFTARNKNADNYVEETEKKLSNINNTLTEISQVAIKTDDDFLRYKTRDYMKFKMPEFTVLGFVNLKQAITYALIGFILACVYVIIFHYYLEKHEEALNGEGKSSSIRIKRFFKRKKKKFDRKDVNNDHEQGGESK